MAQQFDVTSVGVNPAEDRAHRMRMYFLAMTLRVLCVVSLIWVRGWWVLIVGIGAVVLPYFAVMIANAVAHDGGQQPDAPTPLELSAGDAAAAEPAVPETEAQIIVVDAPAERRSSSPAPAAGAAPQTESTAEPTRETP